ncbi:hypothetical protein JGH00_22580 [Salmonella enterica subsp. enterica serovar London]|nr:hypothetical protein [Salmonella enterica subsp. enterica serovar London]
MIMRRMELGESEIGVKIGGRNINNLRYADDTTLLSETRDGLKHLIKRIKEESEKFGLFLNIKKAKLMTTARNGNVKITVNGEEIDCVQEFTFLGSQIDQSGPEIKRRIALGRTAMMSMNQIWKSKDISVPHNLRCPSWTVKKINKREN